MAALGRRWPWASSAGVSVIRVPSCEDGTTDSGVAHWLDWIGVPEQVGLGLRAAQAAAAAAGCSSLQAWLSPGPWKLLKDSGAREHTEVARIGIPTASGLSAQEALQLPWWFMGGDTDFL